MKQRSSWAWFIALALVLIVTPLMAQKITGAINGVVSDPSGAVVPKATVTLPATGEQLGAALEVDHW